MGKDRKELSQADKFRKDQRKQELKKNKQRLTLVRSVQELLSDPHKIDEEIAACKKKAAENKLVTASPLPPPLPLPPSLPTLVSTIYANHLPSQSLSQSPLGDHFEMLRELMS